MDYRIRLDDQKKIEKGIRDKYIKVAKNPEGQFNYPTGKKGLQTLGYEAFRIDKLPGAVVSSFCGVGNPFSLGKISPGESVLDIGCGAGVDTILAAMIVGNRGSAVGVDIVPEMIARAKNNLEMMELENVSFQEASGEKLPFADDAFDVVISNGAVNLMPDKEAVLSEMKRVLKPRGRLMMADQITAGDLRKDIKARLASWFQ